MIAVGRRASDRLTAAELEGFRLDLEAAGAPEAFIQAALAEFKTRAVDPAPLQILHRNGPAVRVFQALGTQWNSVTLSTMSAARWIRTGLKYESLAVAERMAGESLDQDGLTRLRILEGAALAAWAEEARSQ